MPASRRVVERRWCARLWTAACPRPKLRVASTYRPRRSASGFDGSARKGRRVCATAPPDPISCRAKPRSPPAMPSRYCAVSAAPRPPSPPRRGCPRPRSAASFAGAASACFRRSSPPSPGRAMNAPRPARSSTSTSRSSAASTPSATASPATGPASPTSARAPAQDQDVNSRTSERSS
jgi:hypothetical protein